MIHTTSLAGSAIVLTISPQACDLRGRRSTGRQILSMALEQGKLPAWMEAELVDSPPGR